MGVLTHFRLAVPARPPIPEINKAVGRGVVESLAGKHRHAVFTACGGVFSAETARKVQLLIDYGLVLAALRCRPQLQRWQNGGAERKSRPDLGIMTQKVSQNG